MRTYGSGASAMALTRSTWPLRILLLNESGTACTSRVRRLMTLSKARDGLYSMASDSSIAPWAGCSSESVLSAYHVGTADFTDNNGMATLPMER